MVNRDVGDFREDYGKMGLSKDQMDPDPLKQFQKWFDQALASEVKEPTAMTLATVSASGQPSNRIVLLKEINPRGLVFYTNYESRKGREININPKAALNFFWHLMERQVRFEGTISKIDGEDSDAYFSTRPRGSQLGAWVSPQSESIPDRHYLERQLEACEIRFKDQPVPRPPHWGGYLLVPHEVEFWQGQANRLHDRIVYTRDKNESWILKRLAP